MKIEMTAVQFAQKQIQLKREQGIELDGDSGTAVHGDLTVAYAYDGKTLRITVTGGNFIERGIAANEIKGWLTSPSPTASSVIVSILAVVMLCGAMMLSGCKAASVSTSSSATAPTDPYAKALNYELVFSQALVDAKTTATALHTTQILAADGTSSPVLDDATYAKVGAGLSALAVEGTKLSALLAARATPAQISTEMAALTAGLAAQLSPSALGITDPAKQERYVVITSLLSLGLNTLATYVALIPAQEASYGTSRDHRLDSAPYRVSAHDPHRDRAGTEGLASLGPGRPGCAPRPGEREFCQGDGGLTACLA